MTRPTFGTRQLRPTRHQIHARNAALGFYLVFAVSIGTAIGIDSPGGAVLLVVIAFVSLFAGIAAAEEA
jgi:hypothetical protein